MKRRKFITGLAGAAAWPLAAEAQPRERVRRIGVLMNLASDDPESSTRVTVLAQALGELGWTAGRNAQFEYQRYHKYAAELVALAPDVIFAVGVLIVSRRYSSRAAACPLSS